MLEQEIGGYKVLKALGAGGMASVYQAESPTGREVALKFLHPQIANDPNARKRLQREADAINRVSSSGVAKVFEVNTAGQTPYVAMELIRGVTIAEDVSANGTWDLPDLIDLAQWLAKILGELHRAGVVHRDIKPANIMIAKQGPVLIDFGISQTPGAERLTATGLVTGTPGYISPQLIHGEDARPRDDWWAWLCVLLYCASGHPPFGSGPVEVVLGRITTGNPDLSGLPESWQRVFAAGFQVDPERRTSPQELIAALQAVNEGKDPTPYLSAGLAAGDAPGAEGTSATAVSESGALPPSFSPHLKQEDRRQAVNLGVDPPGQETRRYPPEAPAIRGEADRFWEANGGYLSNPSDPSINQPQGASPLGVPGSRQAEQLAAAEVQWQPRYLPQKLPQAWLSCLLLMLALCFGVGAFLHQNDPQMVVESDLYAAVLMLLVAISAFFGVFRARLRDAQLASGLLKPPRAALRAQPLLAPLIGAVVVTVLVGLGVILLGQFGYQPLVNVSYPVLPEGLRERPEVYRAFLYLGYSLFGMIVAFCSRAFRVGFGSIVRLLGGAGARFFWCLVALAAGVGAQYLVVGGYW